MKPETAGYLAKASEDLEDATTIAAAGLPKVAARSAHYAAFHAAEALIVERTGKIAKTHSGVRTAMAQLARDHSEIDRDFTTFLAKAYKYKEISDYSVARTAIVTKADAEEAIAKAAHLLDHVATLIGTP